MIHVDPRTGRVQAVYRDERGVWIARGTFQAREVYRALAAVTAALIERLKERK